MQRPRSESKLCFSPSGRKSNYSYDVSEGLQRPRTTPKPRVKRDFLGPEENLIYHDVVINSSVVRLPPSPPRSTISDPGFPLDYSRRDRKRSDGPTTAIIDSEYELEDEQSQEDFADGRCNQNTDFGSQDVPLSSDTQDEDMDYQLFMEARHRLEKESSDRERVRKDLESYVTSLSEKIDESGEPLVLVPSNFDKVVSLMTRKDMEVDTAEDKKSKSWTRVLFDTALAKQKTDCGETDNEDASNDLETKIAYKMARIRQLDVVLEEKLGEDIYASGRTLVKKSRASDTQNRTEETDCTKTFMTQLSSLSLANQDIASSANVTQTDESMTSARSSVSRRSNSSTKSKRINKNQHFVERNKQLVQEGVKGNLTKGEEARLSTLLEQEDTDHISQEKEYTLDDKNSKSIQALLDKAPNYMNTNYEEDDDGHSTVASIPLSEQYHSYSHRKQLAMVDAELKRLQENDMIVIVPDEGGAEEDDTASVQSYQTTTSIFSNCSSISGVISRRYLNQYIAKEVAQEKEGATLASQDEIKQLLATLSRNVETPKTVGAA